MSKLTEWRGSYQARTMTLCFQSPRTRCQTSKYCARMSFLLSSLYRLLDSRTLRPATTYWKFGHWCCLLCRTRRSGNLLPIHWFRSCPFTMKRQLCCLLRWSMSLSNPSTLYHLASKSSWPYKSRLSLGPWPVCHSTKQLYNRIPPWSSEPSYRSLWDWSLYLINWQSIESRYSSQSCWLLQCDDRSINQLRITNLTIWLS